jgi:hypothetical protein
MQQKTICLLQVKLDANYQKNRLMAAVVSGHFYESTFFGVDINYVVIFFYL